MGMNMDYINTNIIATNNRNLNQDLAVVSVAVDRPLTDITSELRELEANRLRQLIRATNISLITVSPETVEFVRFYVNQSSTRCRVLELRLSI
ncbi:unnamed protein product, partial [Oppiella nova]